MRAFIVVALAAMSCLTFSPAGAQSDAPEPLQLPSAGPAPGLNSGPIRIEWEVRNRFRLFRNEADFRRHAAAYRGDSILASEQRLARASDGRGWARDMVDNLCVDQTGRLPETCLRDGTKESYLSPADHPVSALAAGAVPANAICAWIFDDGEGTPGTTTARCDEEVKIRVRRGRATLATVDVALPDGTAQRVIAEIIVQDFLIAGMGDSIAAGEGNPDRPIALDDGGFCFRRFLSGATSEYFRPGRIGFKGSKACDLSISGSGNTAADWSKLNARWWSTACHRSLYGYQVRTALALAIENPHIAVTFMPLACSGSTIDLGFFNPLRARECPPTGVCALTSVPQMVRLKEALDLARKTDKERKLDAILLTIGANDIWFAGLVANVITSSSTERALFEKGGMIADIADAQKILDNDLPRDFAKVRAALKPYLDGNLSRVIFVTYGNPATVNGGQVCNGGRGGFDVHPAFNVDPERLRRVSEFVENSFLPRMRGLATCERGGACRDPASDRMVYVDSHLADFSNHGFCARAPSDPVFDRECFLENGESFESNSADAATDPLRCRLRARDFRAYAPRARWIRTANDSYFTAMTFPEGISPTLQPSDLHDATWGATSAVYGGAVHPTAEGHAAMADAAMAPLRAVLNLPAPRQISTEPLAPLQLPAAQTR